MPIRAYGSEFFCKKEDALVHLAPKTFLVYKEQTNGLSMCTCDSVLVLKNSNDHNTTYDTFAKNRIVLLSPLPICSVPSPPLYAKTEKSNKQNVNNTSIAENNAKARKRIALNAKQLVGSTR